MPVTKAAQRRSREALRATENGENDIAGAAVDDPQEEDLDEEDLDEEDLDEEDLDEEDLDEEDLDSDSSDEDLDDVRSGEDDQVARHPFRWVAVSVLVTALIAVLAVYGVVKARDLHNANQREDKGNAAVLAAKTEFVNLTTISPSSAAADIKRILAGASPGFRTRFTQATSVSEFEKALTAAKLTSTGKIDSAGLIELNGDTATVLIAGSGTIANAKTPKPTPQMYLYKVTAQLTSGRWLVTGIDPES